MYKKSNSYKTETPDNKSKFFTKKGWLNEYGLACGYQEKIDNGNGYILELWWTNGAYFVRLWNDITMKEDSYLVTHLLTEARENFITLRRNIHSGLIKPE